MLIEKEREWMQRGKRQSGPPAAQAADGRGSAQAGKMLVPLLGILALLSMGVSAFVIMQLIQEKERRIAKEQELHLAHAENDDLKARLEDIQQAKSRIDEELARVRKDLARSQEELAKAVEAQEALSRSVEDREREIGRLTKDLTQTRTEEQQVATQLSELQTERDAMKQQLADLERAKGELESKLMELSERPTVELEKVLVTNPQQGATGGGTVVAVSAGSSSTHEGRVVVINREYDFIVMSLGKNHGVSVGQEFQIVRGNQVLGKVKVEKVYDEISAATLLPGSQKDTIRAGESDGDTVRAL